MDTARLRFFLLLLGVLAGSLLGAGALAFASDPGAPRIDDSSITVSGEQISGTVDPNGHATTVTAEERQSDRKWVAFADQDVPNQDVATVVSFSLDLPPGEHDLRLTATNDLGTDVSATITITVSDSKTQPQQGKSVAVHVVSGEVSYRLKNHATYTRISGTTVLPLGVVLDTTDGRVDVKSAFNHITQTGRFNGGKFSVTQTRKGVTELALAGALACAPARAEAASHKPKPKKKKTRSLWGKDDGGDYRTRGSSVVATVRGTEWHTTDTCHGTTIYVRSGEVSVWPRKGGRATIVRAGQRLFTPRAG